MKNKIIALTAISALCLFGACSDDSSPDPTRGELCQAGLSTDCLAGGIWKLMGATEVTAIETGDTLYTINFNHDFTNSPATLFFSEDGSFIFTLSPLSVASCKEEKTYGNWTVKGKTLTLKTTIGNTCLEHKSWTNDVAITAVNGNIEMDIHGIFFLNSEMENADLAEKQRTTEVFVISAQ